MNGQSRWMGEEKAAGVKLGSRNILEDGGQGQLAQIVWRKPRHDCEVFSNL